MKLKLNNNQIVLRVAYHNYVQDCLKNDIIEIPLIFEEWQKRYNKNEINELLKRDAI